MTDHVLVISGKGKNKTNTLEDVLVSTYTYNGLGQRTNKVIKGGDTIQFMYSLAGSLLAELDGAGAAQREYVYLNNQVLAVIDQVEDQGSPSGVEIILDDGNPDTSSSGNWTAKTSNKANDNDYLLADGSSGSTYRWTPDLTAGTYDVYAWYVKHKAYSVAPYNIVHASQTTNATLDQSVGGNAWSLIATGISFDGSGSEYVEVSDANGKTTADAVRFVNVGDSGGGTVTKVYYVHNDHLGTAQSMTDVSGAKVWNATHDPFGKATVSEDVDGDGETVSMNARFPGQYHDEETNLHYNYFRTYDPNIGRYITSDPIGLLGGINTYGYVEGDPVNWFDPYGLRYRRNAQNIGRGSVLRDGPILRPDPKPPRIDPAIRRFEEQRRLEYLNRFSPRDRKSLSENIDPRQENRRDLDKALQGLLPDRRLDEKFSCPAK